MPIRTNNIVKRFHDSYINNRLFYELWDGKSLKPLSFDNNIPKSFINKLRKLHDSGQRDPSPGAIDIWFQN